jgi:hypothetical protein
MTTCGANSTIMGAIRSVKSAARLESCPGAGDLANAGRNVPAPAPITVAHPSRTKSRRFI